MRKGALRLLADVILSGIPWTPQTPWSGSDVSECLRLRWLRSDEEGGLVPTMEGIQYYEKFKGQLEAPGDVLCRW